MNKANKRLWQQKKMVSRWDVYKSAIVAQIVCERGGCNSFADATVEALFDKKGQKAVKKYWDEANSVVLDILSELKEEKKI